MLLSGSDAYKNFGMLYVGIYNSVHGQEAKGKNIENFEIQDTHNEKVTYTAEQALRELNNHFSRLTPEEQKLTVNKYLNLLRDLEVSLPSSLKAQIVKTEKLIENRAFFEQPPVQALPNFPAESVLT